MKLGAFISCSIAFFPQLCAGTLEPFERFDRWIDYLLHPTGWGQPEFIISGLLVPWTVIAGALGFLAAWLAVAILERTGLTRHVWCLPLCFLALVVLFSALIGRAFFP
jgi:hypothetical protein